MCCNFHLLCIEQFKHRLDVLEILKVDDTHTLPVPVPVKAVFVLKVTMPEINVTQHLCKALTEQEGNPNK